jgi:hypothetical protein
VGLWFLQSCAWGSHLGLLFATSATRIYTCINTWEGDPFSSTQAFLPFHIPSTFPQHSTMEPVKRMASDGAWDCLPEEVISLIAIKVAKTSEDPIKDIHSLRLCNKVMKRMTLSSAIANRFNLEHHYLSKVWGGGCRRAQHIPPNHRLVARCEQWRSPLHQGDGRHMHGPTQWCNTPRTSKRGRRPTSVLCVVRPQVLQAPRNQRCFQPHPVLLR